MPRLPNPLHRQLLKRMDEGKVKKLDAMTAKYAKGGSPTAYVNAAAQLVGSVSAIACCLQQSADFFIAPSFSLLLLACSRQSCRHVLLLHDLSRTSPKKHSSRSCFSCCVSYCVELSRTGYFFARFHHFPCLGVSHVLSRAAASWLE